MNMSASAFSQQSQVLTCRDAMQKSSQGQHAALAALVQNVNFFMPSDETFASTDIRTDPDFWALLRQLLVSSAILSCLVRYSCLCRPDPT